MLVGMLVMLSLIGPGQARLPQAGDEVAVFVAEGVANRAYFGQITDIGEGLMCLNCSSSNLHLPGGNVKDLVEYNGKDLCFSTSTITRLTWMED